jgi:hypothetical protein
LIGVILLIAGFFTPPPQGFVMIAVGLGLASLAGLELSIREHFGGFRSHTLLLAAAAGIATLALLFYALPDLLAPGGRLIAAAAVAVLVGLALARVFRARSGRAFRLR